MRASQCLTLLPNALLQVRSHVEQQIGLVAKGQADKDSVVVHTLDQFRQKFMFFVTNIQRMDALFEASFSPLASSGKRRCDAGAMAVWVKCMHCPSGARSSIPGRLV